MPLSSGPTGPTVSSASPVQRAMAAARAAQPPAAPEDLEAARATSAWAPRSKTLGGTAGGAALTLSSGARVALAVVCVSALLLAAGGVGYAIAARERAVASAGSGGIQGLPSETATLTRTGTRTSTGTRTQTASNSATATASHTNGASASATASGTPSRSHTPTGSTSETSVPTLSTEPSATALAGVAADAARYLVAGQRTSFLSFGDWGRCANNADPPRPANTANCNRQRSMVNGMEEWAAVAEVTAIISTGDQFYEGPDIDDDLRYDYSWRNVYNTPTLRAKPWWMIHGNHDYTGNLKAQLGWGERAPHADGEEWDVRWKSPSLNYSRTFPLGSAVTPGACVAIVFIDTVSKQLRGKLGGTQYVVSSSMREQFASFHLALIPVKHLSCPVLVPFMDTYRNGNADAGPTRSPSTRLNGPYFYDQLEAAVPGDQLAWFRTELANASNTCDAVLVVGHHPVYSGGQHGQSPKQQDLKDEADGGRLGFPSVFSWLGVDAYLNGHDHILEHCSFGDVPVDYITTGAGSDVRTNNVAIPESVYLQEDNGFTVHSFNATHASHIFLDASGAVTHTALRPLNAKLRGGGPRGAAAPTVKWFQPLPAASRR